MSDPGLRHLFGNTGALSESLPGFRLRPGQLTMAEQVAEAIAGREQLIIEAGTGTGKTFAYLVPALRSGRKVVISTGTKSLQDQLYHRDLPALCAALGRPVRIALLKGRANYLCRHRLELAEQQAYSRGVSREVARAIPAIRRWTITTSSGDLADAPGLGERHAAWPWVTSTRENCLGTECPQFDDCFVLAARREAQAADIVVVNHHLLMADLVLKEEGFGELLPGADAIVVDEAHQLPDVAAQFLGYAVSTRQLSTLARDLSGELLLSHQMSGALDPAIVALNEQVEVVHRAAEASAGRIEQSQWSDRFIEALEGLAARTQELSEALEPLADEGQAAYVQLRERLLESAQRLNSFTADERPEGVRWAETSPRNVSCRFAPLEVARELSGLMLSQDCAWILTSATLAVGEDFSHFQRRCGLNEARSLRLESPFDFGSQALLYLPQGLGDPGSPGHARDVVKAAMPVLEASGGRAFLLFTSHRALREGAEEIRQRIRADQGIPVLVQGEASRDQLLREFRDAGNAVLLGTGSFWEGVDVKGPALSVVIIDKLPFAVPDDPLLKARLTTIREQGGNPFFDEQVPQAIIALKQGVGRLIRDESDAGVVMLCDVRLVTKGYGRAFLQSLPPMKRTRSLEDVQSFLEEKLTGLQGRSTRVVAD